MLPAKMGVAFAAAMVLLVSGLVAVGVVLTPFVGLWRRPRASIRVSVTAAAVAAAAVGIQVAAPLTQGMPLGTLPALSTDYFLAMAHVLIRDSPYPFFWSPAWAFWVGTLTPLIAAGGVVAVAAGYPAGRATGRGGVVSMVIGFSAVLAYVVAAAHAAQETWSGIPL